MKKIAIQLKFIWYKYKFVQYKWNIYKTNKLSYTLYNRNEREKKRTQTEIIEYKSILKNIHENYRLQIKLYTIQMEQIENTMFDTLVFVTQKTCSVH